MILEKIKNKLWLISIPVAIAALLSMSAIKDIEDAHVELDNGKRTAYYLRTSTDSLTYLAIAYTSTGKEKFINEFNSHLERRKQLKFDIIPEGLVYYNEGLSLSNELSTTAFLLRQGSMLATSNLFNSWLRHQRCLQGRTSCPPASG
jgi:hypothetical protein